MKDMIGTVALITVMLAIVVGSSVLLHFYLYRPPPVEPARGTIERRLHLKVESTWDTDKPRVFVCREEPK